MLFQEEASLERRRQLNALYKECRRYLRRTQPNSLSKEFGRLKQPTSFGTRQVLWKCAAMAWLDGWLAAGTSTQNAAESEHKEKEAANIIPLPKEAVKDEEHTDYRFHSDNEAYQEEEEEIAKVERMAKRAKHRRARSIESDAFQRGCKTAVHTNAAVQSS